MERTANQAEAPSTMAPPHTATGPILVASDGAPASGAAFMIAGELAEQGRAAVEIVSALEPLNVIVPPVDRPRPVTQHGSRVESRRDELVDLVRRASIARGAWPTEIVLGDPIASIARVEEERSARLVVTGRTRHGSFERIVRHETPLGIARRARVPVLSVPPTMVRLPRRIVVAVGLGDAGARLGHVADVLFRDALAVHLVHVSTPPLPRHDRTVRQDEESDDVRVRTAFERATAAWRLPADVSVSTHLLVGRVMPEIMIFAEQAGADLIVAGLPTHPAGLHLMHRSLAARLYRTASAAVLIVPVEDDPARRPLDGGTLVSANEAEWVELLRQLDRRTVRRLASLAVDDQIGGAHIVARHRPLAGVSYDDHAHAVVISLGDATDAETHLTHRVAHPVAIAVHRDPHGADDALVIGYDGGQALLMFE